MNIENGKLDVEDGVQFEFKASKSNTGCCVPGCKSVARKNPTLRFHTFPAKGKSFVNFLSKKGILERMDRRKAWEISLRLGRPLSPYMQVCSLHFKEADYMLPSSALTKRYLKKTAVPAFNLPKIVKVPVKVPDNEKLKKIKEGRHHHDLSRDSVEIGVQVENGDLMTYDFLSFIETDQELSTLTGIQSFKVLDTVEKIVRLVQPCLDSPFNKLSLRHKIVLTYFKLKQNLSYSTMSVFFKGCSDTYCQKVFNCMIDVLSASFKCLVTTGPNKEDIAQDIPEHFSNFPDVRVILDCTEDSIQDPSNLCCQLVALLKMADRNRIGTG